jgi:hypothetical protein
MQIYKSTALGFSISYPESWQVVPAPWMKQFMGRAKGTSEKMAEYLAAGSPPFLIAHDPNVQPGLAIPALKCQAHHAAAIAGAGGVPSVLASIVGHMKQAFPDFELHEYALECVVAGVAGARLTAAMSVTNPEGESFHGLSEMLFLPTRQYVFAVGLTATSDMAYRPKAEFAEIIRSIRLRPSAA